MSTFTPPHGGSNHRHGEVTEGRNFVRFLLTTVLAACLAPSGITARAEETSAKWPEPIQLVLESTTPLKHDRGGRLPLYLWPAMNPGRLDDRQAKTLVRELDRRGIGLICAWDWNYRE